jgi:hypothetical protein
MQPITSDQFAISGATTTNDGPLIEEAFPAKNNPASINLHPCPNDRSLARHKLIYFDTSCRVDSHATKGHLLAQ